MLLIKNGRVLDPASKTDGVLDVLLDGEKITELGPPGKLLAPQGTEFFDASGLIVAPGFIDIHVRSEEHTSELQSLRHLVCRLLLEKKKKKSTITCRPSKNTINVSSTKFMSPIITIVE